MEAIITSLLETDLYKFSMGQAIFHQFPGYKTTWTFKCRNKDVKFTSEMVEEIKHQLQEYSSKLYNGRLQCSVHMYYQKKKREQQ